MFFFLPTTKVSCLLPLNHSVNFQKPVKPQSSLLWPRWVKDQGSRLLKSRQSVHFMFQTAGGGKPRLQIPPVSLLSSCITIRQYFLQTATKTKLLPSLTVFYFRLYSFILSTKTSLITCQKPQSKSRHVCLKCISMYFQLEHSVSARLLWSLKCAKFKKQETTKSKMQIKLLKLIFKYNFYTVWVNEV